MDLSNPGRVIETGTDSEVLRVLAGTRASMTGRQVARLVRDGSPATVNRSLRRLAGIGILDVAPAGRALMYSLNREHLAAPAVEHLASMRALFIEALRRSFADLDPVPVNATLFGSAARGDGDALSDIDLLIVRPDDVGRPAWDCQIDEAAERIRRMTGNPVRVHEIIRSDLERLATDRPGIVAELEWDAIPVLGEPVDELIRAAAPR